MKAAKKSWFYASARRHNSERKKRRRAHLSWVKKWDSSFIVHRPPEPKEVLIAWKWFFNLLTNFSRNFSLFFGTFISFFTCLLLLLLWMLLLLLWWLWCLTATSHALSGVSGTQACNGLARLWLIQCGHLLPGWLGVWVFGNTKCSWELTTDFYDKFTNLNTFLLFSGL